MGSGQHAFPLPPFPQDIRLAQLHLVILFLLADHRPAGNASPEAVDVLFLRVDRRPHAGLGPVPASDLDIEVHRLLDIHHEVDHPFRGPLDALHPHALVQSRRVYRLLELEQLLLSGERARIDRVLPEDGGGAGQEVPPDDYGPEAVPLSLRDPEPRRHVA